ncbi:response regulator transcription factor [Paenibacillus glycanilyticus]|uniref:response regulator transcription factor n=1 Tax=Paenibacillus glycanilyticus TaxID=126569 RepID=UPI00203FC347|nr:response regulator transcription factor [Paenibacillus glycanilyticus]MCM3630732.1 response regulator transcription factor [Paenibacillus glycanilyticus]
MYTILLVDDEAVVREGIRERIPWGELGFNCVADCENGVQALDEIERLRPHIVLTDINMPFMDGLALSREVMERYPDTKVVILTGYDDFEYAQQALKLKVKDFILKPVTAAELSAMLHKLRLELDEEKKEREDLARLQSQLHESMPLLKERFLERLSTMALSEREIASRLSYFQLQLGGPCYLGLAIDTDRLEEQTGADTDRELLRFAVYNIAHEIISGEPGAAVFRSREERVMAILGGERDEPLQEKAQELAEKIRQLAVQFLKLTVSVGIGTSVQGYTRIRESCKAAVAALDYRLVLGDNSVISILDMEKRQSSPAGHPAEFDRELIAGIKTGTADEVERAIEALIRHNKAELTSIDHCYLRIQKTILAVMQALGDIGCKESEVFGAGVNPMTEIYRFRTMDEIGEWLKRACRQAVHSVTAARHDQCRFQIEAAIAYLESHYEDEELSVKGVCKQVHMSVSYFSAAFKSHTGRTFVEYVTAIRMDKAKELLKFTSLRTYEIAARTGYSDAQYFSVLFKKHTGESPTDYRHRTAAEQA